MLIHRIDRFTIRNHLCIMLYYKSRIDCIMNKLKLEKRADPYEKWLAAQIMQSVLRSGRYPLKTNDLNLVQRILEEIKKKWGVSCTVDYDKSDLLPRNSYTITLENTGLPLSREKMVCLLEILNDLLLNGYSVIRDINDCSVQEYVQLCKEHFQMDCSVRMNDEENSTNTYVIIRS